MRDFTDIVHHEEAGCLFKYDPNNNVLHVHGDAQTARPVIRKLRRRGWVSNKLRCIWFSRSEDTIVQLVVGEVNMTLYLNVRPTAPKPATRSFGDIVKEN